MGLRPGPQTMRNLLNFVQQKNQIKKNSTETRLELLKMIKKLTIIQKEDLTVEQRNN